MRHGELLKETSRRGGKVVPIKFYRVIPLFMIYIFLITFKILEIEDSLIIKYTIIFIFIRHDERILALLYYSKIVSQTWGCSELSVQQTKKECIWNMIKSINIRYMIPVAKSI